MKIIDFNSINDLNIPPEQCLKWAEEALYMKDNSILPPKSPIRLSDEVFLTSMPCYIPIIGRYGVKVISRYPSRNPSLQGELLLYDSITGNLLALMDASWITAMRTGAIAALCAKVLKKQLTRNYSFIGLGNTARATLLCLLEFLKEKEIDVSLLAYKEQEATFIQRFKNYKNINFHIYNSTDNLISNADVLFSCVTNTEQLFAIDSIFPHGILIIPVHTRGFQNCDLFFDKIYADDTAHVQGFQNFSKFLHFDEFSNVWNRRIPGRESEQEKILVYNVGIAMYDVYFASKVYDMLVSTNQQDVTLSTNHQKFWV